MEKDYYQAGISILDEIMGEEEKARYLSMMDSFQEGLSKEIVESVYGKFYGRKQLDLKTRQLITVSMMLFNGAPEQIRFQMQSALRLGSTKEELAEVIFHSILFVGLPKALMGLKILKEVTTVEE